LNPKKILLIRTDRIGELILTTPAINSVRSAFPEAEISLIVSASSFEAVEGMRSVDTVLAVDPVSEFSSIRGTFKFILSLRKQDFDMAVIFNPSKFMNLSVFLAGIPVRVGYDRKLGFLLNRRIADRKYLCEKHEVDYNLDLIKSVGVNPSGQNLSFVVLPANEETAEAIARGAGLLSGEKFIAVHAATSNPEKVWPADRFAAFCNMAEARLGVKVVLVGGKDEERISQEVKDKAGISFCDLTGKLKLKEFAALLKKAALLVSCDSGPVHVSAAVGTPVVALFGESRPGGSSRRWGPYGAGHTVVGKPAVVDISVGEVFEAVKARISL
jgi:lipopolysaccharide heptosyltransferase II